MEDIREEDRGHRTRVFEITSAKLNKTLQICVGKSYTNENNDRYNVYRVSDHAVAGCIGHYDVSSGTGVNDADGDFDIQKYGEPDWIINASSIKTAPSVPKAKAQPKTKEPVSKGNFIIIETDDLGDCFYDSVIRALDGSNEYSREKVVALRNEVGEYVRDHYSANVISMYKTCIGNNTLRYDSYYLKYWNMCLDDDVALQSREGRPKIDFEDAELKAENELKERPELRGKLNPALLSEDTDVNQPAPNDQASPECASKLTQYFSDKKDLDDEGIITEYMKNIPKKEVWADDIVVSCIESMKNVKIIPLEGHGKVENFTVSLDVTLYEPNDTTKFILVQYDKPVHYKLIETKDHKRTFTWEELPEHVKKGSKQSAWYIHKYKSTPSSTAEAKESSEPKLEVKGTKQQASKPPPEIKEAESKPVPVNDVPNIDKMTLADLKAYAKEKGLKFNGDVTKKEDWLKCIKQPELEECKPKTRGKKTGGKFTRRK